MKYKAIFQITMGTERGSFGEDTEVILDVKNQEDANREARLIARSKSGFCSHPERGTFTNTRYNLISVRPYRGKRKHR